MRNSLQYSSHPQSLMISSLPTVADDSPLLGRRRIPLDIEVLHLVTDAYGLLAFEVLTPSSFGPLPCETSIQRVLLLSLPGPSHYT